MAVTMEAHRYGLVTDKAICPVCGHPTKQLYSVEARRVYGQCMNPSCPHLQRKEEHQMPVVQATESNYVTLPTGEYLVQITDYASETGNFGPQWKWSLEVVAPKSHAGNTKFFWTSEKLTGGKKPSNLWKLVSAAFGREPGKNEAVDIDDLIGRRCIAVIVAEPRDDGDGERNRTSALKPYAKQEPFPLPKPGAKKTGDETSFEVGEKPEVADDEDPFEGN